MKFYVVMDALGTVSLHLRTFGALFLGVSPLQADWQPSFTTMWKFLDPFGLSQPAFIAPCRNSRLRYSF